MPHDEHADFIAGESEKKMIRETLKVSAPKLIPGRVGFRTGDRLSQRSLERRVKLVGQIRGSDLLVVTHDRSNIRETSG